MSPISALKRWLAESDNTLRRWRDAYHANKQGRRLGNAIELLAWYCVLALIFALLVRLSHADLDYDINKAEDEISGSDVRYGELLHEAAIAQLSGEKAKEADADKAAKEFADYVSAIKVHLEALRGEKERIDKEPWSNGELVMDRHPVSLLTLLIAAILPWLTLLTIGKTPILLVLSATISSNVERQLKPDTVATRHEALVAAAKAKENSAFSQALLLLFAGILTAFSGVYFFYS